MACDPAQDSANLVQALAAIVSTCGTNESNLAKWSINVPVIVVGNSPTSNNSTNYATLAGYSYTV